MDQDVKDGEAGKGGTTEGPSPSEKEAGLLAALKAERANGQALKVEMAELKGRDAGRKEAIKAEPVREFTRVELQAQVDDGRMTPDESDRILSDQMRRGVTKEVTEDLESKHRAERYMEKVQTEVDLYKQARPDIMIEGTDDRHLVSAEYARQVSELGKPDNLATERDALAAVLGPANRLQNGKERPAQTYQETGGADSGNDSSSKETAPKLPGHVKAHYEKMIGMGMYKGWDDENLKKEIDPEGYGARWT